MGSSAFDVERLDATFGATVTGVNLVDIDDSLFAALRELWLEHALLVFPGQFLTREQQIAFARRIGPLEFDIAPLSNVRSDGSIRPDDDNDDVVKVLKGNMGWHHDSTYMPVQAMGAVFTAEVVPDSGGATGFADMSAAYEALDEATLARIEGRVASHSLYHSQAMVGHDGEKGSHSAASAVATVDNSLENSDDFGGYGFHDGPVSRRPLVKTHPETGRKNLLVGRHAYDVDGLSAQESEALLRELVEFACQSPRIYHHDWAPGDAVLWDNRCLMHQATPWDMSQARIMWHSRIAGDPSTESALLAS